MDSKTVAYIGNVKPFQVAVVAFVAMILVSVGQLIASIIAVTTIKRDHVHAPLKAAHVAIQQKGATPQQALHIAHMTNLNAMTSKFLDGQYGVITLAAIVLVLAFAGMVSASMVVSEVEESGGRTSQDYMWLSSLGSIVLGQGILLMVIAIFTTVEYKAVRQSTFGVNAVAPE